MALQPEPEGLLPRRRVVQNRGAAISFLDTGGDGAVAVFLHGLAGSGSEFLPTAAALPELRSVLVDQRGHGLSTRRPEDLSRAAFLSDAVTVVEALGVGPVDLVGQSMGGHTAMLVAAARPDLVRRLVLVEAGTDGSTGSDAERIGAYFRAWPLPFADERSAVAYLGDTATARAWVTDMEHTRRGLVPRFDADILESVIAPVAGSPWPEWEHVAAETLVVYGARGRFEPGHRTAFLRRQPRAARVDLAAGSHDLHLDALAEWVAVLRGFLRLPPALT